MIEFLTFVIILGSVFFTLLASKGIIKLTVLGLSSFLLSVVLTKLIFLDGSSLFEKNLPFLTDFFVNRYQKILGIVFAILILYAFSSVKIINQGEEALVERIGRYHRKLKPGINFIVPVIDYIRLVDSVRERILDIEPQAAVTSDNVPVDIEAIVYWRILELELTYYAIDDAESGIAELVRAILRSEVGRMRFEATFSSRDEINRALLSQLDEATEPWGIKITRVEVQEILTPPIVQESMEQERASEIRRRSRILESQGEQEAAIKEVMTAAQSIEIIYKALPEKLGSQAILNYLLARQYVSANQKLGESENSKVIFMDPKVITEGLNEFIKPQVDSE